MQLRHCNDLRNEPYSFLVAKFRRKSQLHAISNRAHGQLTDYYKIQFCVRASNAHIPKHQSIEFVIIDFHRFSITNNALLLLNLARNGVVVFIFFSQSPRSEVQSLFWNWRNSSRYLSYFLSSFNNKKRSTSVNLCECAIVSVLC